MISNTITVVTSYSASKPLMWSNGSISKSIMTYKLLGGQTEVQPKQNNALRYGAIPRSDVLTDDENWLENILETVGHLD